jgi:hypothetical protein
MICYPVRRWLSPPSGRRQLDGRWRERRLIGIQNNLFRPLALGFDPDGDSFDNVRPTRATRREFRQNPPREKQKGSKCASNNHKIPGYGHSRSLQRFKQSRLGNFDTKTATLPSGSPDVWLWITATAEIDASFSVSTSQPEPHRRRVSRPRSMQR